MSSRSKADSSYNYHVSAPGVDSRFESGKRGWMALDNSITFTQDNGPRNYYKDAKRVWARLDANQDGTVDENEIAKYLISHKVFSEMSNEDARRTVEKLFREIDTDSSGHLDFDEFCKFYKMVQHERNQMIHASLHHITSLPSSVVKFNKKAYTTEAIEIMLQEKIQQFTSQDSDRFRQILTMFKTQVQRSKDHENSGNVVMGVTKRQFNTVLMWLGLFATKEQAEALFEKYDMNGDGILTVHEFLTRARPTDYPGRIVNNGEKYSFRTGKRMFLKESLNRKAVRPMTPPDDVYHVSEHIIADRIRRKMGNTPGVSTHYNETPLALNDLMKTFAYYDPRRTGAIECKHLKRAFENLNMSMGQTHLELLMDKFNKDGLFDYPRFSFFVYPGKPATAVMPEHLSLNVRKKGYVQSNIPLDFSKPNYSGTFSSNSLANSARSQLSSSSGRNKPSTPSLLKPMIRTLTPAASVANLGIPSSRVSSRSRGSRPMSRSASMSQFRANATQPMH